MPADSALRVTRAELRDFRNYHEAATDLGPGLTVVTGSNGAGKTNLLEAVYFGLTGRSCRTSNEREVVRRGAGVVREQSRHGDETEAIRGAGEHVAAGEREHQAILAWPFAVRA